MDWSVSGTVCYRKEILQNGEPTAPSKSLYLADVPNRQRQSSVGRPDLLQTVDQWIPDESHPPNFVASTVVQQDPLFYREDGDSMRKH